VILNFNMKFNVNQLAFYILSIINNSKKQQA
jgi:hypothetical protein